MSDVARSAYLYEDIANRLIDAERNVKNKDWSRALRRLDLHKTLKIHDRKAYDNLASLSTPQKRRECLTRLIDHYEELVSNINLVAMGVTQPTI